MDYVLYILLGLMIVLGVDCLITAFWAIHDLVTNKQEINIDNFKKYFVKNNNLPTKMSDLFN